ncbi:MAG: hypothetical protein AAF433_19220 [Bacteroidota bacterium]
MKSILSLTLLLWSTLLLVAASPINFSTTVLDEHSFVLRLEQVIDTEIQVQIKDQRGFVLHEEGLSQQQAKSRRYDLRNLPAGNYVMIVDFDNQIKVQPIVKSATAIEVDNDLAETVIKPSLNYNNGLLDANFFAGAASAVDVKIQDDEGQVVYQERQELDSPFHKRYNLTQLPWGEYTFYFKVNYDGIPQLNFSERISIQANLAAN